MYVLVCICFVFSKIIVSSNVESSKVTRISNSQLLRIQQRKFSQKEEVLIRIQMYAINKLYDV